MPLPDRDFAVALVLSGGNALASYQAGAYQALHEQGIEPDWISGASAGAINGALICGNPPDRRLPALTELWKPAPDGAGGDDSYPTTEKYRRTVAAAEVMAGGMPHLFVPRRLFGPWWNPFGNPEPSSLYDSTPLRATLQRLLDFDLLNSNAIRFSAGAVDIETGEDMQFDTAERRLEPDHIRASAALLPAFSPVEIDGRLLGDAGISANLPLDAVLSDLPERPLLCIAIDLLPLRGDRPQTLGDATCRVQDLIFASQSRRALAAWQAIFDERAKRGKPVSATVIHVAYSDQRQEVSGKAFDFSPRTAAGRWRSGYRDVTEALGAFKANGGLTPEPGFSVYRQQRDESGRTSLQKVRPGLGPRRG